MRDISVSVVVATYRREEALKNALLSLGVQTQKNIEVIVVDDNDDDVWNNKVAQIIGEIEKRYPELTIRCIVNHPNQGSAKSRNIGIAQAQGEYVSFLDDDDIYLPEKIERQYIEMVKAKADYSITDLELYNEKGKLIDNRIRTYLSRVNFNSITDLLECHLKYHMTGTDTFMFQKDYLLSIGSFDAIDVGDEFYLMQKAIRGGGVFCYIPQCHVKAYVHTGEEGLSSGQSKINGENQLYEYKKNYFSEINAQSRRYIRMRHYAVLAFAGIKLKNYPYVLKNGLMSLLCDPIQCMKLCSERKK